LLELFTYIPTGFRGVYDSTSSSVILRKVKFDTITLPVFEIYRPIPPESIIAPESTPEGDVPISERGWFIR